MNPTTEFPGIVYLIRPQSSQFYKIGYTTNLDKRISQLQTGSGKPLMVVKSWAGNPGLEQALHRKMSKYKAQGEWFRLPKVILRQLELLDVIDVEQIKIPDYPQETQVRPILHLAVAARELADLSSGEVNQMALRLEEMTTGLIWKSEAVIDAEPFNQIISALRIMGLRGREQKRFARIENALKCLLLWKDVETRWREKFKQDSPRVAIDQVIADAIRAIP